MRVRDVIAVMDEWAPPELAYSWDRCGLHAGDPDREVRKILTCLTVTRAAFAAAKRARAEMIVSHHPLIWDPLKSLREDNEEARLCLDIARAGIACYAAHTNLDVVPGGVNHVLAGRLGLKKLSPLIRVPHAQMTKLVAFVPEAHLGAVRDAVCAAGAGVIGDYTCCSFSAAGTGTFRPGDHSAPFSGKKHAVNEGPEYRFETLVPKSRLARVLIALFAAHPYEEVAYDVIPLANPDKTISLGLRGELVKPLTLDTFAAAVRKSLDIEHVRVTGNPKRSVRCVAVMGGAGAGSTGEIPGDVDVYVTGDVKYHEAISANERGLAVIDAGHHGTEKWTAPAMAEYLRAHCKGVKASAYMEPDPFRVVTG